MILELNYKSFGQGETVIILHGLFGMLDNWQSFARNLAKQNYQVMIVDQRDHGRSPWTDDFSYELLAEDLRDFYHQHSLEPSYLIGHSMGGKACLQFCLEYPEMIKKMVIVDIGIKAYPGGHEYILDQVLSLPVKQLNNRAQVEALLEHDIKDQDTRQFIMKNLSRNKKGFFGWKANFSLLKKQYHQIIGPIEIDTPLYTPTLFVKGGRSKYILEKDWREIKFHFDNTRLVEFEKAGHWVHADRPKELLYEVKQFFTE